MLLLLTLRLGAKYKESVNAKHTNLVISANDSAKTDKAQAALNWNIPVVTIRWLVVCIGKGEWIEPEDFLVQGVRRRERGEDDGERKQPRKGEIGREKNEAAISNHAMKETNLKLPMVLLNGCVIAVSKLIGVRAVRTCNFITILSPSYISKLILIVL